ncbi:GH1 family beta-glucosidase [Dactylosporangium sucinum]|uniref:Beta-glucosidase n=1 Tax=Dactylosporangium sucinum TaxID=1424081 RepID=A0A917TW20_9ACTN|nr:GH1 family beta-glucosidase [Dactylosporangium sucinum]GGM40773.1 beta-glucosidase [Dactylosporangium sucinum]
MRPGFRWGVATSAYQIEGAAAEDGRGPSIWDTFSHTPGAIADGGTGDVACDHYRRLDEDLGLLSRLGVDTYRFSVAWPRVQPTGTGPANPAGLDFYDRLVDGLLARGIDPWLTLYHWDLPQPLEDDGGWPERDTAHRFAEYAGLVLDRLGDRVPVWTTLNEPWCVAMYGYADGIHAPGRRDFPAAIRAVHHLLLGHGLAAARIRARPVRVGITLNLANTLPAPGTTGLDDEIRRLDGLSTRMYLDALVHGRYPDDVLRDLAARGAPLPVEDGDAALIAAPLDVLGVNYYFDTVLGADGTEVRAGPVTGMGWPVTPHGLTALLLRLHREYPGLPVVVTENGTVMPDDADRTAFLSAHVDAVERAVAAGADVRGYFVWTLLDNFEWGHGYGPRFGLVEVDHATQRRTPRGSFHWYRARISG